MKADPLLDRIVINPRVMVGKPIIRGTRLRVEYILNLLAPAMKNTFSSHGGRGAQAKLLQHCPALARDGSPGALRLGCWLA